MPSLSRPMIPGPTTPTDDSAYVQERKVQSFDVAFWPVKRDRMQSRRAIVERLVEDTRSVWADETSSAVMADQLVAMGWTAKQIHAHASDVRAALDAARARDLGNEVA